MASAGLALLFTGTYELTGDRLAIIGTFSGNVSPVHLELTRIQNSFVRAASRLI